MNIKEHNYTNMQIACMTRDIDYNLKNHAEIRVLPGKIEEYLV